MRRAALVLGLLAALAACDGEDPVDAALRDAAAARQAEAVKVYDEGVDLTGASAPPPATPDDAYVRAMTLQHQRAIDTAQTALAQSTDPEIRRMAQDVIESRTREIAEMRAWRPAAGPAE